MIPNGESITVRDNGGLKLLGTSEKPLITSSNPSPQAGDWGYIEIYKSSARGNNTFEWVEVEYGGGQGYGAIWLESEAELTMKNSVVRHSGDYGIQLQDKAHLKEFTGNRLVNNAKGPIVLFASSVDDLGVGEYTPNTVEGIEVFSGDIDHDAIWKQLGVPYVAPEGFAVRAASGSAHLTVEAGATLKLGDGAVITVAKHGGLSLRGTANAPVIITSSKSAPAAGDWEYIEFRDESVNDHNVFEYAVIEYGGESYGAVYIDDGAALTMKNSVIRYSADVGLEMENGAQIKEFVNNKLANNGQGPVLLGANSVKELGPGTYIPNGVEGIRINSETIASNAVWENWGVPYVAESGFQIEAPGGSSAILTIKAGVTLKMGPGAVLDVRSNGALQLLGEADNKVAITSSKVSPGNGDWDYIEIQDGAIQNENLFRHARISYGGMNDYGQLWLHNEAKAVFNNVEFSGTGDDNNCDVAGPGTVSEIAGSTNAYKNCLY